jgi:hypothetical protein
VLVVEKLLYILYQHLNRGVDELSHSSSTLAEFKARCNQNLRPLWKDVTSSKLLRVSADEPQVFMTTLFKRYRLLLEGQPLITYTPSGYV